MADQELVDTIIEKFKKGEIKKEIKEDLSKDGFSEREIDDAFFQVHKMAIKQIPFIGQMIEWWEDFEDEVSKLTPKNAVLLLIALALFLLSVVFFMNNA